MKKHGYNPRLATGSLAAGGTLGILIPPSVGFIFYAIVTEESIGKLFIAGLMPGVLLAVIFMAIIYGMARLKPELAPRGDHFTWTEKFKSLRGIIGMLLLFILILGRDSGRFFQPCRRRRHRRHRGSCLRSGPGSHDLAPFNHCPAGFRNHHRPSC